MSKALKEFAIEAEEEKQILQKVWTTKSVTVVREKLKLGIETDTSCFYTYDKEMRAANILFKYTNEELIEFAKCANDINYFADRYAFAMTDNGITKITLRPYQRRILKAFQEHREVILMSSRQAGKCLLYNSKIHIKELENMKEISIGNLYYSSLKKKRKLTILENIKWMLWKIYDKL